MNGDSICLLIKMKSLLEEMRKVKPEERSEIARRYAVTITEFEKVMAYFQVFVVNS